MHLQIQPTADETQRACEAISAASLPPSRAGVITAVVFAIISATAFLLAPSTWLVAVVLAFAGLIILFVALQAESRWRLRRAQTDDPHANEAYEIEVGPEGIRVWCAHVDYRFMWNGITSVVETPEFYLFLRGPQGGPHVPKRVLDIEGRAELQKIIREHSPDRGMSLKNSPAPHEVGN